MELIQIKNESPNEVPQYATSGSIGMDIRADFSRVTGKIGREICQYGARILALGKGNGGRLEGTAAYSGKKLTDKEVELQVEKINNSVQDDEFLQLELEPMVRAIIPTGLTVALPEGYYLDIRPRSGLAIKNGLTILNAPGLIDSDYRGEIKIILINLSQQTQVIKQGDRIAQMVLQTEHHKVAWDVEDNLDFDTDRGTGGFGSTGI